MLCETIREFCQGKGAMPKKAKGAGALQTLVSACCSSEQAVQTYLQTLPSIDTAGRKFGYGGFMKQKGAATF